MYCNGPFGMVGHTAPEKTKQLTVLSTVGGALEIPQLGEKT